jgi:NAD(P)-dependent dehydrogenase (short-subunit alcohol dehydrogenase family)
MRRVLLVGAGGGMGGAAAEQLIERGWEVTATVSRAEKIEPLRQALPGCRDIVAVDLSDAAETLACVRKIVADLPGPLDAVLVCAAVSPTYPLELTPLELARQSIEINCLSHLAIFQATIESLRQSRGRLVFTSSLSGKVATPMVGAYVASKFALEGLADTMRQEAEPWGVDVVILQPGGIDSGMVSAHLDNLREAIPRLSDAARALYGDLYRQFQYRIAEARQSGTIQSAAAAARGAVAALEAEFPRTRYPIGADAEALLQAAATLSDREVDALILRAYRSAPL